MSKGFLSILFFFLYNLCCAQKADFLVLKKNDHTIKSFFAGSQVTFLTAYAVYSGQVNEIRKDSVFLTEFDIRQVPTNLGVYVLDTVARYHVSFPYRDITSIRYDQKGFNWAASGASLLGGGILLTAIGAGTWIFTKPGTQYHAGTPLVIGSAILGGVGYFLLKSHRNNYTIGKKYSLQYINVNSPKK